MKKLKQDEIIQKLQEGWELGSDDGRYWMQMKLCCGGESFNCYYNSIISLRKKGIINILPRRIGDPCWLSRYGLVDNDSIA